MKDVTLTFTHAELTLLNAAIQELPFKHAHPLIVSINRQIADQKSEDATDDVPAPAANGEMTESTRLQ